MKQVRRSLRHRAAVSVLAILGVVAVLAAAVAAAMYEAAFERSARNRSAMVAAYFEEKLHGVGLLWEDRLMTEKARLEFARLMEDRASRWDRLRAYLASLSASPAYAGMVISAADGTELFRHGLDARRRWPVPDAMRGEARTYFADGRGRVFAVLSAPIWLGPDGMGAMHLVLPLDNGFLRSQAFPDAELFIEWNGRIVASSEGDGKLDRAEPGFRGTLMRAGKRFEQRLLPFPTGGDTPVLIAQAHIPPPFSVAESAALGFAIFVVLALLLAAMLRRWLVLLLPRFEQLVRAAQLFAAEGRPSPALAKVLDAAEGRHGDELSAVAHAMHDMATTVAQREQERADAEARLRESEGDLLLAEKVFANSDQAILITDARGTILRVNPAFSVITGYPPEEAIGRNPAAFASGRHGASFYAEMWGELKRHGAWAGEVWDRRRNGEVFPKWLTINAVHHPHSGAISHYVGIFSDIAERKEREEHIERLAFHDPLTGLPNRFALQARLTQSLADARRNSQQLALMFIDLDHFKTINDSLGHHIGDQLLVAVSRRIRAALRETDTVARLGGDEFVIVAPGIVAPEDAARVAEKIIEQVGAPLALAGHTLHTSPSIGIGLFPGDGADADTLMKNADMAMYYAKQHGRNAYHFFAADMDAAATERMLMETQLRVALERGEMHLVYQPQIDLASGAVVGVEALLRWQHPERGTVSPAIFIPVAEETGIIMPLGAWVLEEACRQAKAWDDAGLPPLRIAVNLSARQFHDRRLAQNITDILARTGLPAERLELEITESVVMENAQHGIETLRALRDQGIGLAVDDFGTGYSSLAYLKRFPIGRVKIDRSFVMDLEHDANDAAIARGIVVLAASLGIAAIAEGIENPAQLAMLKDFGCVEGQGYLFSRPLSADDFAAFLQPIRPMQHSALGPPPLLH